MNPLYYKVVKDSLTGIDGESYDGWRILCFIGVLSFMGYAGWHLYANHAFSALEYGSGLGALLFGGGAGVAAKSRTEPDVNRAVRQSD